ncbi:MAG: hypothetical protein J3R72DRAFT_449762 [Linnemannia gamsii]|nr:MAG: hypothetical protein J3R72DRAFT_449762 [Linnemannia gamsii]
MFHVLRRLHSLWSLILFLSTTVLIATMVFFFLGNYTSTLYLPIPLTASLITIILFAYGIWGKTNPYLMPTSSPRSNPCTRSVRHFGTSLLSLMWIASSVSLITTDGPEAIIAQLFAGLTLLILILVIIESIASNRIGKEQRRILKEEERKLALLRATTVSGSTLVGGGGSSLWKSKKHGNNGSRDSGLGSLDNNDNNSINNTDTSLTTIEIVRPEAIDPATVIYSQQVLFESAQRQYNQQYHQYFLQESKGTGSGSDNGSNDGHSEQQQQEGKYDDILLESSYKFEVPMDVPLSHDTSGPSTPPLGSWASKEKLHLPSAPPVPAHSHPYSNSLNTSFTIPPKASQGPATAATSSSPSSSSLSSPSTPPPTKTQQHRTSLLKCDISSVGIQIMTETNPFRDQDYRNATDLSASAPPYEPSFPSCSSSSSVPTVVIAVPELSKFEGQSRRVGSSSSPFEDHGHHHHSNNVYNSNNSNNSSSHNNETIPTMTATTSTTNTGIILGVQHNRS